ncbi:MAG TPA: phosphatase PAP2 family protein [Steroidobacteraceae bacterium]|nr:phosphatase PAP2 family protein [Steroidobacteraceae bacterium]
MTSLRTLDQRLLDQRLTGMNPVGGMSARPRYNTQIMTKFIDTSQPMTKPLAPNIAQKPSVRYNQYWDADLQSYMYLQNFVKAVPGWMDELTATALANGTRSQCMDPDQLDREIRQILDLAPEREERFMEIMDQDDAEGANHYWFGMLQISPSRHPATYLMVRVGRRIGEHVVMCLKGFFRSPRPSQLCPAIVPMIDPPSTPSFPAGHAVQAYLISYLLAYSLPKLPQQYAPEENLDAASGVLFDLAERVSVNRIVAGLHYPTDIIAGRAVGIACFKALTRIESLWSLDNLKGGLDDFGLAFPGGLKGKSLRALVQDEFPQYV